MEIILLVFLVLLNGILAMSEIAVVSSRKVRLQKLADEWSPGAQLARCPARLCRARPIPTSNELCQFAQGVFSEGQGAAMSCWLGLVDKA